MYPDRYEDRYGYFRSVIRETVYKYLGCGDLKQGFARVRCRDCGHEYLLAYSCKRRYFCTSCHTKRAVAFAEWLHTTVLWPVAHRQIVLTIPKILRAYFRYDRRLLGDLCRVAAEVLVASFHVLLDEPTAEPGLVVCVHSFGNLLNFHPHLHVMATDGGFTPDDKIRCDPKAQSVIYKTKMVPRANRNFEVFDPLDFLAAVTSHIPNRGEHLVRYYGYHSSVQRGRRRRQGRERMPFGPVPHCDDTPHARAAHASWARFIKKVFTADPLECPDCGGAMRIIAFIEERRVVRAIL